MAWAFDVASNIPRITQSGVDSGLTGIATAINAVPAVTRSTAYTTAQIVKPPAANGMFYRCSTAGTTSATAPLYNPVAGGTIVDGTATFTAVLAPVVQTLGTQNHYFMPAFRFNITGQLTNANPQAQNFTCLDFICSATGATFTSGQFASDGVTPLYNGLHLCAVKVSSNGADESTAGFSLQLNSECTFIGGEVQVAAAVAFSTASTPRSYQTRWRNTKDWGGVTSSRFRSNSTTAIFRDCEFFDMAYDLFRMPAEFSVKARGSEYLAQYVGSQFGGADAKFVASNLENVDGIYDFDNFGSGWVELYNCKQGAALRVVTQHPSSTFWVKHCVPLYQDVIITAKDTTGAVVQDVRFTATENPSNPPTVTFVTQSSLKTWDFRTPVTYQTTTNASGIATSTPVLNVWYWQTSFRQSLRFPNSTATYQGRAYNYKTTNVQAVLGASAAIPVSAGMIGLDTATTVSEATALAQTGISLIPSGANGGTLIITQNKTLQDIWNYYRAWISAYANRSSDDTWNCLAGALSTGAWDIVIYPSATVSTSANITSIATTGALSVVDSATMPYLFNLGGVLQSAGILLPNTILNVQDSYTGAGAITTIYTSSAGTSSILELVGVTNNGVAAVWHPSTNATELFQTNVSGSTATYTVYYPAGSAGLSKNYARESFGNQRVAGSITLVAGLNTISFINIPDVGITQTNQSTVLAYTAIEFPSKRYDRTAAFRLTEQGIKLGQIATRAGTSIEGTYSVSVRDDAPSVYSILGNVITIKAPSYAADSKYSTEIITGGGTFTAFDTEVITIAREDANGDSQITIQATGVSTFEIWKITDATSPDNYATGTLVATVGIGTWRFLSANGFKFVVRDTTTNYRVVVEAEKGIYNAELFFGAQVQLAQAAEVTQINTKVDILQNDLDIVIRKENTIIGLVA